MTRPTSKIEVPDRTNFFVPAHQKKINEIIKDVDSHFSEKPRTVPLGIRLRNRRSLLLIPTTLGILLALYICYLIFQNIMSGIFNSLPTDGGIGWMIIIIGAMFVFYSAINVTFDVLSPIFGRILQPDLSQKLQFDTRPPVLFLRPFKADGDAWASNWHISPGENPGISFDMTSIEEIIERACDKVGPMVAIGNPEDSLPHIGAARSYVPADTSWQDAVLEMMLNSRLIVIMPGESQGVTWEIKKILENNLLTKSLIILPRGHSRDTWTNLARNLKSSGFELDIDGLYHDRLVALHFGSKGEIHTICSAGSGDAILAMDHAYERDLDLILIIAIYSSLVRPPPSDAATSAHEQ